MNRCHAALCYSFAAFSLTLFSLALPASSAEPHKLAVITYMQETCTFCPGGDTQIEDRAWRVPFVMGDDLIDRKRGFIGGFVHAAREYPDVQVIGINSPDEVYGGSSRSWESRESFEHFMSIITEDLKANMPVDGVYLALHGALAVRDIPRPEAEIARRIRQIVGPDIPIAGSFDLHGNEDEQFLQWANAAFVTKRYPHYDASLQGERSARFLYRSLKGLYNATTATRKPPIITASVLQWTGQSPSMDPQNPKTPAVSDYYNKFKLKMENLGDPYDDRVMKNVPPIARDPLKREEVFGNLTPGAKPVDD